MQFYFVTVGPQYFHFSESSHNDFHLNSGAEASIEVPYCVMVRLGEHILQVTCSKQYAINNSSIVRYPGKR